MNKPASPTPPPVSINLLTGILNGPPVTNQRRSISDLRGIFADESARAAMAQDTLAYDVQLYQPQQEGTPGALYFGNTTIQPGTVNGEYFMTKGHVHALPDRTEYYLGIRGEGFLLFMDRERRHHIELMRPGSLHFIAPHMAHRVINTGNTPLNFLACWPADAGHDYDTIKEHGFPVRVFDKDGEPAIVTI